MRKRRLRSQVRIPVSSACASYDRAVPSAVVGFALLAAVICFARPGCSDPRNNSSRTEPGAGGSAMRTAMERNADCCMCHQPFLAEPLSLRHAKHNIACDECHGPSRAHSTDEKFQTPPDVVIKPNDVDPFCLRCHDAHEAKAAPRDSLAATNPEVLGTEARDRCTSCHGRHHIARLTTKPRTKQQYDP